MLGDTVEFSRVAHYVILLAHFELFLLRGPSKFELGMYLNESAPFCCYLWVR